MPWRLVGYHVVYSEDYKLTILLVLWLTHVELCRRVTLVKCDRSDQVDLSNWVGSSEPQWSLTWFAHTVEYELMVPLVPYAPGQAWYFEPSRTNEKSQHGSQYYASRSPGVGVLKTCGSVQGSHAPWIRH